MEKDWMTWYKILPSELLGAAYKTRNGELAWRKEQALHVIDILSGQGYKIVGVEPWLPTNPGPTPLIFDWRLSRHATSNKFPNTPADFIKQFDVLHPLQNGQEPVFNFSVQDK